MHKKKNLLKKIAAERIGNEFVQIISGRCESLLENFIDVFQVFIPELTPCIRFQQNNPHHDFDVWNHTIKAVGAANGDLIVRLAAFYHDIGKPKCYCEDENGIGHFYGHAKVSAEIAEKSMRNLRLDNKLIADVTQLVESHDRVIEPNKPIVRRCLNKFGELQFLNLIFLQYADKVSQRKNTDIGNQIGKIAEYYRILYEIKQEQSCFTLKDLAINGNDLMRIGYIAGKSLGTVLNQLLELVMDDKIENDKEKLLMKAQELLNERAIE